MGKFTISMAIFHSYVRLPEGNPKLFENNPSGWNPKMTRSTPFHQGFGVLMKGFAARGTVKPDAQE